jgi:hypothetical protein
MSLILRNLPNPPDLNKIISQSLNDNVLSSLSKIQSIGLEAQKIADSYPRPFDTTYLRPSNYIPKTTFTDEHKVFFDELEVNSACIDPALEELQKLKDKNLNFVEIIILSIEIANRKFLDEIDNRGLKEEHSPNYNYFINLLFQDEDQKYISLGFNIDYSAGYFRNGNFFFYDKKAERQVTTYGIQFTDEVNEYESEKVLIEHRNQKLNASILNQPIIDWLKAEPVLKHYTRGKKQLAKNGGITGFEFKLSLYLDDMDQPIKLDKDDKPLIDEYELKFDHSISSLFVNNRQVKFPKKKSQEYQLLKYIFTDKLKTDYLNPKLIIAFLRAEKVIDNVTYDKDNLRDAINRLNTKIKNKSSLKDNFLVFDGGKIIINKTIKLI